MLQFLQPGMVTIDVGAHHGFYTLLMAHRVGPKGRVIAIEPSPRERRRLKWHVWLNRCRQVRVEPYALADYEGVTDFFLRQNSGSNSLAASRLPFIAKVTVRVTTLDTIVIKHKLKQIDLIKIDVEGAELLVLKGANLIFNLYSRPVIISEFNKRNTFAFGYESVEIYDFLKTHDFCWFNIAADGRLIPAKRSDAFQSGTKNMVAVPKERLREVEHLAESPCPR